VRASIRCVCVRCAQAGTFHLRTTILPREEVMADFVDKFKTFHKKFMDDHR